MSILRPVVPAVVVLVALAVPPPAVGQSLDLERRGFQPPPGVSERLLVGDLERVRDVGDPSDELRILHDVQNVSPTPIIGLRAEWTLFGGRRLAVDNRWARTAIKPGERVTVRFSVEAKTLDALVQPGTNLLPLFRQRRTDLLA